MAPKMQSLVGQRFGLLVVQELDSIRNRPHLPGTDFFWKCLCDCGKITVVKRGSLTSKNTKSCGCHNRAAVVERNKARALPKEESFLRSKLRVYKESAKKRHKQWDLIEAEFRRLMNLPCFYCGIPKAHGVDRADSSEGYTLGNSRPCCTTCNYAKNSMSETDFLAWVSRVYKYQRMSD